MSKSDRQTILNTITLFTGTERYHRFSGNILLTDGAKYLAEACGAYWLNDIICSVQTIKNVKVEDIQVCHLQKTSETTAVFTMENGSHKVLYVQEIPFTDFPLNQITLWACSQGNIRIIMLPSEY